MNDSQEKSRHGVHRTPRHGFVIPDKIWLPAKKIADARGETMTQVVQRALARYAQEGGPPRGPLNPIQ